MQKETLILASNNAGKLREMREILEPFGLEVRSQKEAGFTAEVAEIRTKTGIFVLIESRDEPKRFPED